MSEFRIFHGDFGSHRITADGYDVSDGHIRFYQKRDFFNGRPGYSKVEVALFPVGVAVLRIDPIPEVIP